jgi:hypothetical protein
VAAINAFRAGRERRLARLVVCCRLAEYERLPQVRLQGAILVQPLNDEQVDAYLGASGAQVAGLRAALRDEADLRELAATPLLLNIMVLTYQGALAESLPTSGTLEERRSAVLTAYVQRMFTRRTGTRERYPRQHTVHWLAWLARALSQHSQTVFYLENLQPSWLSTRGACRRYVLVDRLGWGLLFWLFFGLAYGLFFGLAYGLAYGLIGGLVVGLAGGRDETSVKTKRSVRQLGRSLTHAGKGLVIGLVGGLLFGLVYGLIVGGGIGLLFGLLGGLPLAIASMLASGPSIRPRSVAVVETVRWSPTKAVQFGLVGGLVVGLVVALVGGLAYGLYFGLAYGLAYGLIGGLVVGLAGGLLFGLAVGLLGGLTSGGTVERAVPNQGIRRSARRAITVGLAYGLVVGLLFGLLGGLFFGLDLGLSIGLFTGLAVGLLVGLFGGLIGGLTYGGQAGLSHLALRIVLWREGAMPLNYVRFLEYAKDRIFLRRVGGGYIFIHRLVQEHFAANEAVLISRVSELAGPETR